MGASLAHLIVMDFNLDNKQWAGQRTSIDMSVCNPEDKANREFPIQKSREIAKWGDDDRLVRLIQIPLVLESPLVMAFGLESSKVDVSGVRTYPIHKLYGGTSSGFGTDPGVEEKMENEPGFFIADGVRYDILSFVSAIPDDLENSSVDSPDL